MRITLKGKPISTSHIYRGAGTGRKWFMSSKAKALKEDYQWQAKEQWDKVLILDPIVVDISLYFGDKRKRDWDNWHNLSMDALSGVVWVDDVQIQKATVEKCFDKEDPRIEIEITVL